MRNVFILSIGICIALSNAGGCSPYAFIVDSSRQGPWQLPGDDFVPDTAALAPREGERLGEFVDRLAITPIGRSLSTGAPLYLGPPQSGLTTGDSQLVLPVTAIFFPPLPVGIDPPTPPSNITGDGATYSATLNAGIVVTFSGGVSLQFEYLRPLDAWVHVGQDGLLDRHVLLGFLSLPSVEMPFGVAGDVFVLSGRLQEGGSYDATVTISRSARSLESAQVEAELDVKWVHNTLSFRGRATHTMRYERIAPDSLSYAQWTSGQGVLTSQRENATPISFAVSESIALDGVLLLEQ